MKFMSYRSTIMLINPIGIVGQSNDVLAGSVTSPPVRIQPHLAVSNNQFDPWPSFRCLSLQYPSTGQVTS